MHPTQPLYHRSNSSMGPMEEVALGRTTGAEVWHDGGGDLRDRVSEMSEYGYAEDVETPPIASTSSSPTLIDPTSPSFIKRQNSVSVSFVKDEHHHHGDSIIPRRGGGGFDDGDDQADLPSALRPPDPVPWRTLLPLLMFFTADAMTYSVLFPIITDMLTSFQPPLAPDMIGLYAGLGEGVMMLVEAVCSPFWARAADTYGRRVCLIYGFGVTVLGSVAIGWSRGVASIIVFRSILGLNPSGVVARLMAAEISTPSNRTNIFSILSPSFSIGMLMGTLLGGLLAHPYGRLPAVLGGSAEIWRDWPFALPCVFIAAIDLVVVLTGYFMLVETKKTGRVGKGEIMEMAQREGGVGEASTALLRGRESTDVRSSDARGTSLDERLDEEASVHWHPPKNIIRATLAVPSFLLLTAVFLLFQISTFSWDGMYAVYTYTAPEHGGLGLSVDAIGVLYSVSYLASFTLNPLLLPSMTARWGAKKSLLMALSGWVVLGLLIPLSQWAAVEARWVMWGVVGVQVIIRALGSFGWALCDVLTLSCFDDYPELMATSSAISCIGGAGGRAFGPALSGWLYSISSEQPQHSWGRQLSWIYLILASSPAIVMAWRIPASADARASSQGSGESDGSERKRAVQEGYEGKGSSGTRRVEGVEGEVDKGEVRLDEMPSR